MSIGRGSPPTLNFYPRPPRGGRRGRGSPGATGRKISIHALREEGDLHQEQDHVRAAISIHALREEGDPPARTANITVKQFLSTPSARRATNFQTDYDKRVEFLSTPSARRATHFRRGKHHPGIISIHALREEGDVFHGACNVILCNFYPRPPRGGRLGRLGGLVGYGAISIHALREEGDGRVCSGRVMALLFLSTPSARRATAGAHQAHLLQQHFYPRPPRGGRLKTEESAKWGELFLSTPSARRATTHRMIARAAQYISIHALREEGDPARSPRSW